MMNNRTLACTPQWTQNSHRTTTALTMTRTTTTTSTVTTIARHTTTFAWRTPTCSSCRFFLRLKWRRSCEQQLHKGWSILKDRDVLHAHGLPRILKGNGVDITEVHFEFQRSGFDLSRTTLFRIMRRQGRPVRPIRTHKVGMVNCNRRVIPGMPIFCCCTDVKLPRCP